MAKFVKKCGVDFKHREWGISEVHSVKVRRNIPRETLCALDRVVISKNHVTTVSYCCACVDYANKNCVECGKDKEVPIQNEVHCQTTPSEFKIYRSERQLNKLYTLYRGVVRKHFY